MKVRSAGYQHYGLDKQCAKEIIDECLSNGPFIDDSGNDILKAAADLSNVQISAEIYDSIRNGLSYEKISQKRYVPISKVDFYAYRRLCLKNYCDLLIIYRQR